MKGPESGPINFWKSKNHHISLLKKKKIKMKKKSITQASPQNTHISDCICVLAKPEGGLGHAHNASLNETKKKLKSDN